MMKAIKSKKAVAVCVAALLVAGVALGATTLNSGTVQAQEEPVSKQVLVDTGTPFIGDVKVTGEYIGTVEPDQQVYVIPKAAGEVLAVHYNVGDTVQEGDVLLELDSTTLRNAIAQTQAGLSKNQALAGVQLQMSQRERDLYYSNLEEGYNSNLAQAEAAVRTAENAVEKAGAGLVSARRTWKDARDSDYVTDMEVDQLRDQVTQMEIGLEAAQLGLQQAKENLDIARKSLNDNKLNMDDSVRINEINANLSQQYLALQEMQDNLEDYNVKAPISGVIEQRNVDPYDMASQAGPVFVISNKGAMTVSFKITEASFGHVKIGDSIEVEKNGNISIGTITEVSTMVDAGGMFTVKATVRNAPADLYTGSAVKIYADSQKAENTLLIPLDALYYDNGTPYVYIAENGIAKKVIVEAGIYDGQNVQILAGLSMSDQIITTWNANLADGVEITLASAAVQSAGEDGEETADADEETSEESETADDESEAAGGPQDTEDAEEEQVNTETTDEDAQADDADGTLLDEEEGAAQ